MSVTILMIKAVLDFCVTGWELGQGNPAQAALFFTFALVDLASIGVL